MSIDTDEPLAYLAPIASALAGRPISLQFIAAEPQAGFSDGRTIFIPSCLSEADQRTLIIAQALFLRVNQGRSDVLPRLLISPRLAPRFLLCEIVRAARQHTWLVPRSFSTLIEIQAFPYQAHSAADSLVLAKGRESLPSLPHYFGCLRPAKLLRTFIQAPLSADENAETLRRQQQQLDDALEQDRQEVENGEDSDILKLMGTGNKQGLSQSLLEKMFGAGSSKDPSGDEAVDGAGELDIGRVDRIQKKGLLAKLTSLVLPTQSLDDDQANQGVTYPEWNASRKRYRSAWTRVQEVEPFNDFPITVRESLKPASSFLIRQLSGIGLAYQWHDGEEQGDELLIDRVVNLRISQLAGYDSKPTVYRAARKNERDLGVLVLLDVSGSTMESDVSDNSVFSQQSQLAYALVDAFERLGDHAGLYAFQSWGRKKVRFLRLKSFYEQLSSKVLERFEQLDPCAYTRMGAAIRHASYVLKKETRLPHRLLILLTDSYPYDDDYEHDYADSDVRKALEEARADGTACVCISIASQQDKLRMQSIFGSTALLSVDEFAQFEQHIRKTILSALAEV